MQILVHSHVNKTNFHMKGFTLENYLLAQQKLCSTLQVEAACEPFQSIQSSIPTKKKTTNLFLASPNSYSAYSLPTC